MPDTPELKDQDAREVIRNALDKNLMVLAGAGAGKTHELIGRMINTIARGGTPVQHLAAITFTRKAAGEMRSRLFSGLSKAAKEEEDPEIRTRLGHALSDIDKCYIGTIHAFCSRLLRERPVEAGLSPDFVELEERDEEILRSTFWHRHIQDCHLNEDPRLTEFENLGIKVQELYNYFKDRCLFSDLPLKPTEVAKPDLTPAIETVLSVMNEAESRLPDDTGSDTDGFMKTLQRARHIQRYQSLKVPSVAVDFLKLFEKKDPKVTLRSWQDRKDYAKSLRDEIYPDLRERIVIPALNRWREYVYACTVPFIENALAAYDRHRLENARLTFQDLLLQAAALLRTRPDVREFFQQRYHRLFVDEFQDTDPVQAELLFYLTATDTTEEDWRRLIPKPGSLFLVGDEKQSIYRFRRADVETFRLVSARISESGGEVLELNTSFRTLGKTVDWLNKSFNTLFDDEDKRYQASFAPIYQYRPDGTDLCGIRKLTIPKIPYNNRREIATLEAEAIAESIAAAMANSSPLNGTDEEASLPSPASPGDFLILTRTRKTLPIYARALEEKGIPYDLTGGGRIADSEEFRGLVDLFETLYVPEDPLPFIAYLRGPFVGLGDDDLYHFRQAGGRFNYTYPIPPDLASAAAQRLEEALDRLKRIHKWLTTKSPGTAFDLALRDLGLIPYASTRDAGASRAGNLIRLLALVREWEDQGHHWGYVVNEMRTMVEDESYKVEEMTLESGREDVVRLMNVHQAKGLEGRVVFLADAADDCKLRDPNFHVTRTADVPYLSLPLRLAGRYHNELIGQPAGWADDAEEETRFLSAEVLRLIYVAATRARNLLVISHYPHKKGEISWNTLYPFIDEIPELEHPAVETPVESLSEPIDLEAFSTALQAKQQAVAQPTYQLHSVTGSEEEREAFEQATFTGGRGRDYGSTIHHIFERAIKKALPENEQGYIQTLLQERELEHYIDSAMSTLSTFRASDLWQEIEQSEAVYTEVPFATRLDDQSPPVILRGVIDLAIRTREGWKLVDYKTDTIPESEPDFLTKKYAPQVETYAKHWEALSGETVSKKGIWSTEIGWVSV